MNAPLLPSALAYGLYLHLAWGVVAACAVLMLSRWLLAAPLQRFFSDERFQCRVAWVFAAATALAAGLPAPYGLSAYLALALQSPSLLLLILAAAKFLVLWQRDVPLSGLARQSSNALIGSANHGGLPNAAQWPRPLPRAITFILLVLGWALVVDTLNLWPQSLGFNPVLYAWGFGAPALWTVLLVAAALLVATRANWLTVCVSCALFLPYAAFRLPTGNVWDALLDPFVFVMLHVWAFKRGMRPLQR
jgi:hypothetical protein